MLSLSPYSASACRQLARCALALRRGDLPPGQLQAVARLLFVGGHHPAGQYRQALFVAALGRVSDQSSHSSSAGAAGELLDQQRLLVGAAGHRFPGDVPGRVAELARPQTGEVFLPAVAVVMIGVRSRDGAGSGVRMGLRIDDARPARVGVAPGAEEPSG
jgi:hypothetical protein